MFRMLTGSEFQAAGPATANELSAKRVLVRRTTSIRPNAATTCAVVYTQRVTNSSARKHPTTCSLYNG